MVENYSPGGQINDPSSGKYFSFHPSNSLFSLRPLKDFLVRYCALQGPSTSLQRCFQNYRETLIPYGQTCVTLHTHTIDVIVDVRCIVSIGMTSLPVYAHTVCDTRLRTVCHARHGGPRTPREQLLQPCAFVKKDTSFCCSKNWESPSPHPGLNE